MTPLGRRMLRRAKRANVARLARWLGITRRDQLADRVALKLERLWLVDLGRDGALSHRVDSLSEVPQ